MNTVLTIINSIEKDAFINKILDDFIWNIWLNAIIIKIQPYSTASLAFLAWELKVEESEIKALLIELILEGRVQGKIDQAKGFFEKSHSSKDTFTEQRHLAVY